MNHNGWSILFNHHKSYPRLSHDLWCSHGQVSLCVAWSFAAAAWGRRGRSAWPKPCGIRKAPDVAPSLGISPGELGKMVSEWEMIYWLVVWNIFYTWFILPYIGNNHPNWLSYFSEGLKPPTSIWWYGKWMDKIFHEWGDLIRIFDVGHG